MITKTINDQAFCRERWGDVDSVAGTGASRRRFDRKCTTAMPQLVQNGVPGSRLNPQIRQGRGPLAISNLTPQALQNLASGTAATPQCTQFMLSLRCKILSDAHCTFLLRDIQMWRGRRQSRRRFCKK